MTAILAVQFKDTVLMCGDTRITNDGEYSDGTTKVFKVGDVLVGTSGHADAIELLVSVLSKLKAKSALEAARKVQKALPTVPGLSYSFLFASVGEAVELTEDGLMRFDLNEDRAARAGSGGLVAEVRWDATYLQVTTLKQAQNRLEEAVACASMYRVDCGSDVRTVVSGT